MVMEAPPSKDKTDRHSAVYQTNACNFVTYRIYTAIERSDEPMHRHQLRSQNAEKVMHIKGDYWIKQWFSLLPH